MKIAVVGLGKAGLPLACTIADSGLNILGVDVSEERVKELSEKKNPIPEEPGVQEVLDKTIGKNFNVTSDPLLAAKECDFHIVIVPLFIDDDKKPDFSILQSAFTNVGKGLKKGDVVVLETTAPPGTTESLIKDILESESGLKAGVDFYLAYSPERIMTGYSISRYKEFPKVVGGLTDECGNKALEVYSKFCTKAQKVSNAKTAELIKVAEGVYRDVNIGLANELYKISEKLDVDFFEMKEKANHAFCNIHDPGIVGGHCIPVYPWFLINNNELKTNVMKTSRLLSDDMANYYADKLNGAKKVAVAGLSYREGVKEKAYSGAFLMIKALKDKGHEVYGLDPMYDEEETQEIFDVPYVKIEDVGNMDGIVLLNKIGEYKEVLMSMKDKVVDVKNILK